MKKKKKKKTKSGAFGKRFLVEERLELRHCPEKQDVSVKQPQQEGASHSEVIQTR